MLLATQTHSFVHLLKNNLKIKKVTHIYVSNALSFFKQNMEKKFNLKENLITVDYNKNRHQFKNSECGVYSINFVEQMIQQSFKNVTNNIKIRQ